MRKLFRVALVVFSAVALTLGVMQPASAEIGNGTSYSRAVTPGYNDAGGAIRAYLAFASTDDTKMVFRDLTVNDTCPGDGNWAGGRAVVEFMDDSVWYGPPHLDKGGCTSPQPTPADYPFDGSKRIKRAGVQALVMNGATENILVRGAVDWRNNQYT